MSTSVAHLMQEASILVTKLQGFKEAVSGMGDPGEATIEELSARASALKSLFRTHYIDSEDDIERVTYTFGGIADLLDRMYQKLAAIGGISSTRFMSQSPLGMNATGESDTINNAMMVAAEQERLGHRLTDFDLMIARNAGLEEALEYTWVPLVGMSEKDQAEAFKMQTEAFLLAYQAGGIDEDELRERLSTIEGWGELGPYDESMARSQHPDDPPPPAPNSQGNSGTS